MSLISQLGSPHHITRIHLFFDSFRRILDKTPISISTINSLIKYSERTEVMEFIFEFCLPDQRETTDNVTDNSRRKVPIAKKAAFQMPLIDYERAYPEFLKRDSPLTNELSATRTMFLTTLRHYLMRIMAELASTETLVPYRIRIKAREGIEWEIDPFAENPLP